MTARLVSADRCRAIDRRNRARAHGVKAQTIGARAEVRVLDALRSVRGVASARRATPEEDAAGVDVVVTTASRTIRIQVKSSRSYAWKHRKAHPTVPYVVAGDRVPRHVLLAWLDRIVSGGD